MKAALCETIVEGIENNRELQIDLISEPEFLEGTYLPISLCGAKRNRLADKAYLCEGFWPCCFSIQSQKGMPPFRLPLFIIDSGGIPC